MPWHKGLASSFQPRQWLDLPFEPPVAVFLVEDAEDHDARGCEPIVDSIITDSQAIERWGRKTVAGTVSCLVSFGQPNKPDKPNKPERPDRPDRRDRPE